MTFLESIARLLCARSGGRQYTDARGTPRETAQLVLGTSCFLHEAPSAARTSMVVVKWGAQGEGLPQDDPRKLQPLTFVVYTPDWFENDARVSEIIDVFGTTKFSAPSTENPRYEARVESAPKPQPEGREEETERCTTLLDIQFQYVTL